MSLANKINTHFESISIKHNNSIPQRNLHLYADYVELVSLFSNANFVTPTDIEDRLTDEGLRPQVKNDEDQAEDNDKEESFVNDIFRVLYFRSTSFAEYYPFDVVEHKSIVLKNPIVLEKQKLYIYLLLAANLSNFRDFQPELTTDFEQLAFHTLKDYLPDFAEVKQLGKNSDYRGSAITKIQQLSDDIKVKLNGDHFNSHNIAGNQERGLDIIAWLPFKDSFPNKTIYIAQCACGVGWSSKIAETKRYESYWKLEIQPIHTLFTPQSLIQERTLYDWFYQSDDIHKSLIFERGRILDIIKNFDFIDSFECMQLVDKCITFEEDIV